MVVRYWYLTRIDVTHIVCLAFHFCFLTFLLSMPDLRKTSFGPDKMSIGELQHVY
jgi:hypothetical protein